MPESEYRSDNRSMGSQGETERGFNKRLESAGWGLFLAFIGAILLAPPTLVPQGSWLIGAGLIMLGVNVARYLNHIKTSGATVLLGILALVFGVGSLAGLDLPFFPIAMVLCGLGIILRSYLDQQPQRSQA